MEEIVAKGHPNIVSAHKTTIEITKEKEITKKADCVIGVAANKGLNDLSEEFKRKARENAIMATLTVGDLKEVIIGRGHLDLTFSSQTDIVIRKSNFVCPRTLMINADKSSKDLDRKFVDLLRKGKKLIVKLDILDMPP
jgi:hypothetical protein